MSWQRRFFKDDKVWVKVDDQGEPVVEDGRVPMRYSNEEDAKVYRASPKNISSKSADALGPQRTDRAASTPTADVDTDGMTVSIPDVPEADGRMHVSHTVPNELCDLAEPLEGIIEIHTDGACSGNPGPCGYGVVIRQGFHYRELSQYIGRGTNNIAELLAIKVALKAVDDRSRPVRLYTDSRYCLGVLTKGWKAKANRELILSIRDLIKEFDDLEMLKIKGHAGEPLNERADTLATSIVDDRK